MNNTINQFLNKKLSSMQTFLISSAFALFLGVMVFVSGEISYEKQD